MSKELKHIIVTIWLICLSLPVFIIIYKLIDYLLNTPFKEWHITILWIFITPVTLLLIFIIKDKGEVEDE